MSNQISVYVKKNQETNLSSQAQLSVLVHQFKRDGYEISSWLGSDGNTYTDKISISTDTTISARWKLLDYAINYELDGGENHPDNPTSYTIESETIPLCAATKYQHAFQKWTENGNEITEISSGSMGDKTLSANFVRSLVTARYHANVLEDDRLRFVAQEAGSTIKLENVAGTYQTSYDGVHDWTDYELGTLCTLTNVGDMVYFKARLSNDTCWNYDTGIKFQMTGKIKAEGNIQYLLDLSGECLSVPDYCYYGIFRECSAMTQAPELPATTLVDGCYSYMFYNCTSLTQAPVLPATTLANYCYNIMFYGCTSLTQAPVLPAKTLADSCYFGMFYGCTSLTQAPVLPATTLASYCYYYMFSDCSHLSVTTDSTKQGAYQILSVGSTTALEWGYDMFTGTAGDFGGTPETGIPYYCYGN